MAVPNQSAPIEKFPITDTLIVHCFLRDGQSTSGVGRGPLFILREWDLKVIRTIGHKPKCKGPNQEQALRACVRQGLLSMSLKTENATKEEIQTLKSVGVLGKRAPSGSLIGAADLLRLLQYFSKHDVAEAFKLAIAKKHGEGVVSDEVLNNVNGIKESDILHRFKVNTNEDGNDSNNDHDAHAAADTKHRRNSTASASGRSKRTSNSSRKKRRRDDDSDHNSHSSLSSYTSDSDDSGSDRNHRRRRSRRGSKSKSRKSEPIPSATAAYGGYGATQAPVTYAYHPHHPDSLVINQSPPHTIQMVDANGMPINHHTVYTTIPSGAIAMGNGHQSSPYHTIYTTQPPNPNNVRTITNFSSLPIHVQQHLLAFQPQTITVNTSTGQQILTANPPSTSQTAQQGQAQGPGLDALLTAVDVTQGQQAHSQSQYRQSMPPNGSHSNLAKGMDSPPFVISPGFSYQLTQPVTIVNGSNSAGGNSVVMVKKEPGAPSNTVIGLMSPSQSTVLTNPSVTSIVHRPLARLSPANSYSNLQALINPPISRNFSSNSLTGATQSSMGLPQSNSVLSLSSLGNGSLSYPTGGLFPSFSMTNLLDAANSDEELDGDAGINGILHFDDDDPSMTGGGNGGGNNGANNGSVNNVTGSGGGMHRNYSIESLNSPMPRVPSNLSTLTNSIFSMPSPPASRPQSPSPPPNSNATTVTTSASGSKPSPSSILTSPPNATQASPRSPVPVSLEQR